MLTNSNMTIYSKVGGQYYRSHIYDVAWQDAKHATVSSSSSSEKGLITADSTKVFIPKSSLQKLTYLKPKVFKQETDKNAFFTLQKGDLIVKGICLFAFTDKLREAQLREQYDDVMMITSIIDNMYGSERLQHFELEVQ